MKMQIANDEKQNHHLPNPKIHNQTQNHHIINPNYPSQCYQRTKAAISNFSSNLVILVESIKELSEEESVGVFSDLEKLKQSISFVNKYFAEVVLKN